MAAVRTSRAWQGFRYSNLIATSAPARTSRNGDVEESDGAEEDGFVGTGCDGSQEMMMEIMDKYVQAGEALAEKENDVRQLAKQVDNLKAANRGLEDQRDQLTKSNDKLADDEGRWYSLARELESQLEVIKKGETYTLFQDKVDEAEARLEVSTASYSVCKKRLDELYAKVSPDFTEAGEEEVDEHRQHATILAQLQKLKTSTMELETALAECIGERDATEQKLREAEFKENQVRRDLEAQVSALKQEAAAHNAVSQSVQDELRKSASEQAEELRQAVERMAHLNQACAEAESKAKAAEEARLVAVDGARDADASLERIEHSLQLVQEEKDDLRINLANVTSAFEACQEDLHRCRETKTLAQSGHQQASERLVALEKLVEDTQGQNSRLGGDLDLSIQRVAELTTSIEAFQGEANAASARIIELEAAVTAKQEALRESAESLADAETLVSRQGVSLRETGDKVAELEARLHASQGQLHTTQEELHESQAAASTRFAEQEASLREAGEKIAELERQLYAAQEQLQESNAAASTRVAKQEASLRESGDKVAELERQLYTAQGQLRSTQEQLYAAQEQVHTIQEQLHAAQGQLHITREQLQESQATAGQTESQIEAAWKETQDAKMQADRLREDIDHARADLVSAQDAMARSEDARRGAQASADAAHEAKAQAEGNLEALREALFAKEEYIEEMGKTITRTDDARMVAEAAQRKAQELLVDAQEAARRAILEKGVAEQARGASCQEIGGLRERLHDLEGRVGEAAESTRKQEIVIEKQRSALREAQDNACQLENALRAAKVELDARTLAVARTCEAAPAAAAGVAPPPPPPPPPTVETMHRFEASSATAKDAHALFGAPPQTHLESNGTTETAAISNWFDSGSTPAPPAPPAPPASTKNEADQLQAHAEAMELELRYTLESFEGQLSAMAREKVALQKQVKELTGQCGTVRKQVSHYRKLAKESEAQVEQMVELQQQLCDAEAAVENLRITNGNLTSKIEKLEASAGQEALWRQSKDELLALRARLAGADERESVRATELAAKSEEVLAARAHHATLTSKTEELESELRALHDHAASVATELARALSRAKELESAAARVPELEVAVAALADEKTQTVSSIRGEAEQAQAKVKELGIVVRSLQEDKERALHKAQQADREREGVMAQLGSISTSLGCALCDGNDSTAARVMEEIRILMTRLEASENVIQDAVHVLKQTSAKEEGGPAEDSSWIISGITDLQGRLRVAEMKVSESLESQQGFKVAGTMPKHVSTVLDCESDEVNKTANGTSRGGMHDRRPRSQRKETSCSPPSPLATGWSGEQRKVECTNGSHQAESQLPGVGSNVQDGAHEARELLAGVQGLLGCGVNEVLETLNTQQSKMEQLQQASTILDGVLRSYVYNMQSLASAVSQNVNSNVAHLLAQASELCSNGTFLASSQEGLAVMNEVTFILVNLVRANTATDTEVALQEAQEEIYRLTDTLRKERLMMMVFRRWGHFYLALSNQALRKRTRERNQVRNQRHTPPQTSPGERTGSDGAPPVSFKNHERVRLSSQDIQVMVEKEVETVSRELAEEPSLALLDLTEARSDMDEMAMRAQARLASVFSQPTPTAVIDVGSYEGQEQTQQISADVGPEGHQITSLPPVADCSETPYQIDVPSIPNAGGAADVVDIPLPLPAPSIGTTHQPASSSVSEKLDQVSESVSQPTAHEALQMPQEVSESVSQPTTHEALQMPREVSESVSQPTTHEALQMPQEVSESVSQPTTREDLQMPQEVAPSSVDTPQPHAVRSEGEAAVETPNEPTKQEPNDRVSGSENKASSPPPMSPPPMTPPKSLSSSTPPPMMMPSTDSAPTLNGGTQRTARKTGPLVEHGISKAERAEFLRKQREERKANRKKAAKPTSARKPTAEPVSTVGMRNRRSPAPAGPADMPVVGPGSVSPQKPAPAMAIPPAVTSREPTPPPPVVIPEADTDVREHKVLSPLRPPLAAPTEETSSEPPPVTLSQPDSTGAKGIRDAAAVPPQPLSPKPAMRGPPPRMFNPAIIPPPTAAPPSAVSGAQSQAPRHPSIAFSVNETVEKALKIAEGEKRVAERRAIFWKCRFRDLAMWATSFVVLSYASDHALADC